eukprot:m.3580 g.3580  ORF g.3580 m.3580 type:complete len:457 (+) comp2790_c0_seq1:114-1484(+)
MRRFKRRIVPYDPRRTSGRLLTRCRVMNELAQDNRLGPEETISHSYLDVDMCSCGDESIDGKYSTNKELYKHPFIELKKIPGKGEGWVAGQSIQEGTLVLVETPVAMAMDSDVTSDCAQSDTAEVIIALAKCIKRDEHTWDNIKNLFPRPKDLSKLPPWKCDDIELASRVENSLKTLKHVLSSEQRKRLKLIVKYNLLSMETFSEQFCYPSKFSASSGFGLFVHASYFNHSCQPNVSRFCVGNALYFRTNQFIPTGQELCISYIESELLHEHVSVKAAALGARDFGIADIETKAMTSDMSQFPLIATTELQDDLWNTPSSERLELILQIMADYGRGMRPCDLREISLMSAMANMHLGNYRIALNLWRKAGSYTRTICPPNDESLVTIYVHAALCGVESNDFTRAKIYLRRALSVHNIAFGSGINLFEERYGTELERFPGALGKAWFKRELLKFQEK